MTATLLLGLTGRAPADEPNVQIAGQWWSELSNVVTPVGWRDHLHRFHIVYDGTILARPPDKPTRIEGETEPIKEGVQLTFLPSADGALPPAREDDHQLTLADGSRVGNQGWTDDAAPVLWSRLRLSDDIELRHLVFAHMLGGKPSETGIEPMFAWIRIEAARPTAASGAEEVGFLIKLNSPHIDFDMLEAKNVTIQPKNSAYPRALRMESIEKGGALLVEEDGKVRLAVLPGGARAMNFTPRAEDGHDNFLHITLPATEDAHVDLLLPMIRCDRATLEKEMSLGREGALAQGNAFWSPRPETAATVHTPEPLINAAIASNVRLARMISLTIPSTKQKTLLSGSLVYSMLWNTPTSMTSHMLLDPLGWHEDVEKYLEIHRHSQGKVKPPGDDFPPHAGYFGVPAPVDAGYQWLTDHGAVLYTAARHALLTGDQEFIEKWEGPILKACEFIRDARRLPRKPPQVEGVMPAASASDKKDPIQSFWSDGWNYKGLSTAARLLRQIDHPRAHEFEREADDYRKAIVTAFRAKAERMPKWKDRSGRERPIVPMALNADDSNGYGIAHPFYLDTGPLFGVYAGVLPAGDPLMRDAADFFRQAPHVAASGKPFVWDEPAYLLHEMSSAEPCYSWNVFHSHQLADRQRYLECMYSLFTGALSRQTHVSCETRGGITENVFASTLALYLARLAVIDDEIEPGSLHLMRLTPLAWISAKETTRFENMPTEFGPVTLGWTLIHDGKALQIEYLPRFRRAPRGVTLHVPPITGLIKVVLNGRQRQAAPGDRITP